MQTYTETEIIVSLILTWAVGLSAPLIIRYFILRRPIKNGWVAALICAVFWIANIAIFTLLSSASKAHGSLFFIALVSFIILMKPMKNAADEETIRVEKKKKKSEPNPWH